MHLPNIYLWTLRKLQTNSLQFESLWAKLKKKQLRNTLQGGVNLYANFFSHLIIKKGQCFSSTHSTVDIHPRDVLLNAPDITRPSPKGGKYIFSDGVGRVRYYPLFIIF